MDGKDLLYHEKITESIRISKYRNNYKEYQRVHLDQLGIEYLKEVHE